MLSIIAIVIIVITYYFFFSESKARKYLRRFPGSPLYPIVGNALQLRNPENTFKVVEEWYKLYGSRIRIFLGTSVSMVLLVDPIDLEKVLTSQQIIDKGATYDMAYPWLGDGLLLSTGKKWHQRRKMLTPAFHFNILEKFQTIFDEQAKVLVKIWGDKASSGESVELHKSFCRCALDIICETAMGKKLDCQNNEDEPYAVATIKQSSVIFERTMTPWLHNEILWPLSKLGKLDRENRKILHDFTDQVIRERKLEYSLAKAEREKLGREKPAEQDETFFAGKKRFAFLDLLIHVQDTEHTLTDKDIREETDTFMFEGHDTTSAGLTWTTFLLAHHPEHQAAVQEELDSVFGDDPDRTMVARDLSQLKLLEACIKEAQRLYPSVPFIQRNIVQDFQLDERTILPAGSNVLLSPWLTHRNAQIYPQPEKFQPSRHFVENSSKRHPYAYIPFSAGPRNCIGQRFAIAEEKTLLAHIFLHFNVELVDPPNTVRPLPELIVRPKDDIKVKLTPRRK